MLLSSTLKMDANHSQEGSKRQIQKYFCQKEICSAVTYTECVFGASVIQHANRICYCAVLLSMACLASTYFPKSSHKRHNFQGGGKGGNFIYIYNVIYNIIQKLYTRIYIIYNMCFDSLYNFCLKHFSF